MKEIKKKTFIFIFIISLFVIILIINSILTNDSIGFVIGGNRISFTTRKEGNSLLIDITKKMIKSDAYQGTVYIAVSPRVPAHLNTQEYSIRNYQINFSNSKTETFTVQCPFWQYDYIVMFRVGTEQAHRQIKMARFNF